MTRNGHARSFRWIRQHKTFAYLLCCGLVFGGPVMIAILGMFDSMFDYHARIRIVYYAFGVGFSIDDLLGIGLFCSGLLTSLLNIPGVMLTTSLYRMYKADDRANVRDVGRLKSFQALLLWFLLVASCLLIVIGVALSFLIVVIAVVVGPPSPPTS